MPIRTVPLDQAADKWVRRASVAGADYKAGVTGAGPAWEAGARAAKDSYAQGVTEAIGRDAYTKGIANAGAARYERGAVEKGVTRFPQGVAVSQQDYMQKFAPFLQAIAGLTLGPRGPSGDPRNYQRSQQVGEALARLKRR